MHQTLPQGLVQEPGGIAQPPAEEPPSSALSLCFRPSPTLSGPSPITARWHALLQSGHGTKQEAYMQKKIVSRD